MTTDIWVNIGAANGFVPSTLVQVMACCLVASSHYLDQCGFLLMIRKVLWHAPESSITLSVVAINLYNEFKIMHLNL